MTARMRTDWNLRAKTNARHFVQNAHTDWTDEEFFRTGEINVANEVMSDMGAICGGSTSPLDLSILEIGCGVGRMTRMLSRIFRNVIAVDVSDEMVSQARENTADLANVSVILGDGQTLQAIESQSIDFAFSFIVFQHIPYAEIFFSYCAEVYRVLKPGGLFKFQVQGDDRIQPDVTDTWIGKPVSREFALSLARHSGFVLEREQGQGSQYYWLWFRKPAVI